MTRILSLLAAVLLAGRAAAGSLSDDALRTVPWSDVVADARGGTVNFFLWGGDDRINRFVSGWLADRLAADYGITLNRVGVADTAEAVNQILSEKEAGLTAGGAVDLVWINGENFRGLKAGGLLFCGYPRRLPSAGLVDWSDPSIAVDFGTPVDGCEVPWSRAAFAFATDAARVPDPPRTVPALLDWIRAHPGRFTYPAPPDFNGAAFVRLVFTAVAGRPAMAGPFDQAVYDRVAPKVFALLNGLKPALWREGMTYPRDIAALNRLYGDGVVDFTFNYEPTVFGAGVADGRFPPTTRSYALDDGTLANTSYLAIPFDAADKAAAMVTAEVLLSVDGQVQKARPEVWGMASVLDPARLAPEDAARFAALPHSPAVAADADLAARAMPEAAAAWAAAIEKGWIAEVGNGPR